MRTSKLVFAALLGACGGGSDAPDGGLDGPRIDAPAAAPAITSFVASPAQVPAGTATDVTWMWTYGVEPTLPDPACTIDNGVGPVTRGQATSVTISSVTTFTLTCTNSEGTAMRQVVVAVPPAPPLLATFTAGPATLAVGFPTTVTWTWTYSNVPSPAPTCTIEGIGMLAPGGTSTVTQAQSRVYRLRCTNSNGASVALTTVNVDECASGTDDCQANATCLDTGDGFTCQCNGGFTGNGDVCSAQVACGATPALCDPNATCTNGTSCVCNATYVGDGLTCQRMPLAFVTSTTGTGNLSTWIGAGGLSGLAAADAVCQSRALAANLPGTYVAWMSDSLSDAYCRVHGMTGKKSVNCGQPTLPVSAGPWVRLDGRPFAPSIDRLLNPTRAVYYPASFPELGTELSTSERVYTGTDDSGVLSGGACSDWTSGLSGVTGAMGEVHGGGGSWTDGGAIDPQCATFGRLRCLQVGAGPPLPSRHPTARRAFVTSTSGTGNLGTWPDAMADGVTGLAAGDAICQARARSAGFANAQTFKAWLSSASTSATTRILTNGPWARPDGVVLAATEADLVDGRLAASLYVTETGAYLPGATDTGNVWTGTSSSGSLTASTCSSWTSTFTSGTLGRHDLLDARWTSATTATCSADQRLYCFED